MRRGSRRIIRILTAGDSRRSGITDRVLTYAIGVSVAVHLVAVSVIGRASGSRLDESVHASPQRLIRVDFVKDPNEQPKPPPPIPAKPKPRPDVRPEPQSVPDAAAVPQVTHPGRSPVRPPGNSRLQPSGSRPTRTTASGRPGGRTGSIPGNPGGGLDIGSRSANGDLGGNLGGGHTPVGWVPSTDGGRGAGSGTGPGTGYPDPPRHVSEGPGTKPAPPPPPPPRTVAVRVCNESGLLPGDYCKRTHSETFVEGKQPKTRCGRCKPPEPEHTSRLADQEKPVLVRDSRVNTSSLDEGLNADVQVEYTVTATGDVTGAQVVRSSGNKAADRAVLSAVSGLKYKPAVQNGVPRSVKMTRTYKIRT